MPNKIKPSTSSSSASLYTYDKELIYIYYYANLRSNKSIRSSSILKFFKKSSKLNIEKTNFIRDKSVVLRKKDSNIRSVSLLTWLSNQTYIVYLFKLIFFYNLFFCILFNYFYFIRNDLKYFHYLKRNFDNFFFSFKLI